LPLFAITLNSLLSIKSAFLVASTSFNEGLSVATEELTPLNSLYGSLNSPFVCFHASDGSLYSSIVVGGVTGGTGV
jgi:hypothetical protein